MPQSALFTGIIPPVSTIFTADGQLDKPGTAALIDDLIKAGVDGLFFWAAVASSPSSAPKSVKPLPALLSIMSIVACRC